MTTSLFSFPNPVNNVAARTVATGVLAMAVLAIALRAPWITIPLAYGFIARVLTGPKLSPLGRIATQVVAPRLGRHARLVPGPPKRFAQGMGAAFALSVLLLWVSGESAACYVLLAILIVPATLESVEGYCVGCEIFSLLMRAGVIPESICLECADLYGARATARRAKAAAAADHGSRSTD